VITSALCVVTSVRPGGTGSGKVVTTSAPGWSTASATAPLLELTLARAAAASGGWGSRIPNGSDAAEGAGGGAVSIALSRWQGAMRIRDRCDRTWVSACASPLSYPAIDRNTCCSFTISSLQHVCTVSRGRPAGGRQQSDVGRLCSAAGRNSCCPVSKAPRDGCTATFPGRMLLLPDVWRRRACLCSTWRRYFGLLSGSPLKQLQAKAGLGRCSLSSFPSISPYW
jgi:hypothetical protein